MNPLELPVFIARVRDMPLDGTLIVLGALFSLGGLSYWIFRALRSDEVRSRPRAKSSRTNRTK